MTQHTPKTPKRARLSMDELSVLCEQFALILRAGLPLHDGVEALCDNYRDSRYEAGFATLSEAVLETGSLCEGLTTAGIFPAYMIEMARIGEKTGELESVMEQLSAYYEREGKIKRSIQNAITYPLLLIVMMAVLIIVLIVKVLPIFESVFRGMGIDLASDPWLNAGLGIGKFVLIAAAVFIALVLVFIVILRFNGPQAAKLFRMFAPLQRLNEKLCASRFASTMSMMLQSGFPLDESLELIGRMISDSSISRKVEECRQRMNEGMSFPDAVEQIGLFPKLHCRMIRVGFQAGQTDRVMNKLANLYEEEMDEAISRIVAVIEPSLVALMSVIIGAILLSIMLPLLTIMGGMA